jgi:hypothetical protein
MNDMWREPRFDDPDELHRLLHDAVAPLRPAPNALPRLRHRVAARRKQRQAMTMGGAAAAVAGFTLAAVLFGPGAPVPGGGTGDDGAGTSASGGTTDDGTSQQATGTRTWPGEPPPGMQPVPPSGTKRPPATAPTAPPTAESSTSPTAKATKLPVAVAPCTPGDLRKTDRQALIERPDGVVGYGYLEFENASGTKCSVTGPPKASIVDTATGTEVGFTSARRSITESPALAQIPKGGTLVLNPKAAFRFQFAWTTKAVDAETPCVGPNSADPTKSWALRYQLGGKGPVLAQVALPAACKGTLSETDLYLPGEYPEAFGG